MWYPHGWCTVYTYTAVVRVRSTGPGARRFSLFKAAATLAAHRPCRAYRVMRATSTPTEFFFFFCVVHDYIERIWIFEFVLRYERLCRCRARYCAYSVVVIINWYYVRGINVHFPSIKPNRVRYNRSWLYVATINILCLAALWITYYNQQSAQISCESQ